jgi:curved DNA-binding protein CbpA
MVTMSREDTHYDVLGVSRRATPEQIQRAYEFLRQMYDDVALATYSLLDPQEARVARSRVKQAYEALRDPERRRDYDLGLDRVAGVPPEATRPAPAAPSGPPLPVSVLGGVVTGQALRLYREQRGVSLEDISSMSKVGVRFLRYIEDDRHSMLPARVYLRSFLQEYAKALGLDPFGLADAYLSRVSGTED